MKYQKKYKSDIIISEPPAGWSPAEIDDYSKIVSVGQGSSAELACVGRGNPLPTYRWSFQGKDLSINNVVYSQRGGNLFIENAQTVNSGDYTCNISNPHGSALVKTQLIVTCNSCLIYIYYGHYPIFQGVHGLKIIQICTFEF